MSLESLDRAMKGSIDLSVGDIIAKYGDKQSILMAVQKGEIADQAKAVMAGMAIDRIAASALKPSTNTVAQETFAPTQMELAAAQQMQGQPQMPGQGLDQIPVSDQMFTAAGGGIVAFQGGGLTFEIMQRMTPQEKAEYRRTGKLPAHLQDLMESSSETNRFSRQGTGVPMSSQGLGLSTFAAPPEQAAPRPNPNLLPSTSQMAAQSAAVAQPELGVEDQFRRDYEMQQRILGEDPTRQRLKELYEKQEREDEEGGRKDRAMRLIEAGLGIAGGTSPYFAANLAGAIPALKGYGEDVRGRRKEATERAKGMAELEGMTRKEKAEVLGRTMAERREDKKTREKQAFDEKVIDKKIDAERKIAGMKNTRSASEYIGDLLRSKDPADREVGRQLLGSSKSGEMTTAKAIELVLEGNPTLGMPGKEKELEAAVQRYMNLSKNRTFAGFSSRQLD